MFQVIRKAGDRVTVIGINMSASQAAAVAEQLNNKSVDGTLYMAAVMA